MKTTITVSCENGRKETYVYESKKKEDAEVFLEYVARQLPVFVGPARLISVKLEQEAQPHAA